MSRPAAPPRAVRVDVPSEPTIGRHDYADAFAIELRERDPRTAEEFARDALENAAWQLRAAVRVGWALLGFRRKTRTSPDHLFGSRVTASEPAVVRLQVESSLMRGVIVGRRRDPSRVVVATYVTYKRPLAARSMWVALSPMHRWLARRLIERAATIETEYSRS